MQNGQDTQAADATQATLRADQLEKQPAPGPGGALVTLSSPLNSPMRRAVRFDLTVAEGAVLLLGRGRGVDIDLDDTRVSRRHAQITARSGKHFIEDLGSIAGTEVNGTAVHGSIELSHGDRIQAGKTGLVYSAPGEELMAADGDDPDDTATAVPMGSGQPAAAFQSQDDVQDSYRRSLTAVVGLIAMILAWMLVETF